MSFTVGCGPSVPPEELGQVVYHVPRVSGADEPYPIPELNANTSKKGEKDSHEH